ncbi:MAG: 16S rRNA (cytosine(1402)-N(4))-methyltransferase RsmH [Spirochaetales bacterium]|nr:16S rRNA (cytosine(1402)-N(4))-methyltransferase RsmH [Spirochaetales bacterium]
MDISHRSVLKEEVLELLAPRTSGELLIDCTLGEGGHSECFLSSFADLKIVGLDADTSIQSVAKKRLADYGERIRFFNVWFNTFFREYPLGDERPDSILFDLGISVYHYEKSGRGFTFNKDEPLDMRLESGLEISAADIVNNYPEEELANLIYEFGEEKYSRRISKAILRARSEEMIITTKQLADIIWNSVPVDYRYGRIHPGTRTFQALRIAVNGELARLKTALSSALSVLKPGGRMGVISFHSLEDRIVKHYFRDKGRSCTCPPEWPICKCGGKPVVKVLTKRAVRPSDIEIKENPPSRSARFRVIEKLMDESD